MAGISSWYSTQIEGKPMRWILLGDFFMKEKLPEIFDKSDFKFSKRKQRIFLTSMIKRVDPIINQILKLVF